MKKTVGFLTAMSMCSCMLATALPATAADDAVVYGTMNIPYADFYRAEFQDSANAYEVDAVSSATTTKWSKNGEGELFEGSYNQANEDGSGTILGVTYPVAIAQADLDALGDDNYNFTQLDETPAAYKTVTVTDGTVEFSTVQDSTPETLTGETTLSTATAWGDYLLEIADQPADMGAILGAVVKTTSGNRYAMRHEENIWRGELAWSTGITTTEPHGNTLSYENFVSMMGETIDEVTIITENGYYVATTDLYVPVKFAGGEVTVESGDAGSSSVGLTVTGYPEDYNLSYSIADNFTVADGVVSYTDAMPGSYTLNVTDADGKYAPATTTFTLSTDAMPADVTDEQIVKAEDAEDADYSNFMSNIKTVSVNGTSYNASGRGAAKIITADGTIDFTAQAMKSNVFSGSGDYEIVVSATGYNNTLSFTASYVETGDVDKNAKVEIADAYAVLCYYAAHAAGNDTYSFATDALEESKRTAAADINGDGSIAIDDAYTVLSYYARHAAGEDTLTWADLIQE